MHIVTIPVRPLTMLTTPDVKRVVENIKSVLLIVPCMTERGEALYVLKWL